MNCRIGEAGAVYFRTERFACMNGKWYFSTREDLEVGPFTDKGDAQAELHLFIRHMAEGGVIAEVETKTAKHFGAVNQIIN